MAHHQLANIRYNTHAGNAISNEPQHQNNQAVYSITEKDVMKLLPPNWKSFKEANGEAMAESYTRADGLRVRPQLDQFHSLPEKLQNVSDLNYQPLYMLYNTSNGAGSPYYQHNVPQKQQREASEIEVPKSRPMRKRRRPPHSYASLIAQAILTSQYQRMTLREIYEWVQTRYPHLYEANETGWQVRAKHYFKLLRCMIVLISIPALP